MVVYTECEMMGVWASELGLKDIDPNDNFFELGGRSIVLIRILSKVSDKTGKEVDLESFFENPCITNLMKLLEN